METDPPQPPENSDQAQAVVSTTTDDQQQGPRQAQARSYECTFCKRGFSNAQALGGHMNIHRKDKAKLKQASNYQSSKTQPLYSPNPVPPNPIQISEFKSSSGEENRSRKWPGIFSTDQGTTDHHHATSRDDHETHLGGGQLRQLPLFAETVSWSENRDDKGLLSSHELGPEVDLELRLGHEPQQDSSTAGTGIKKFF
ncbi:unnamed protein product [Camellia sinensis]